MSSQYQDGAFCINLSKLEWVWYNVVLLYISFFVAGLIHEFGHGLGNGLTGGDFGFQSNSGFIGGYGLNSVFMGIIFVFRVRFIEGGNRLVMLIAGPAIVILLAWLIGLKWNLESLDGPCGGLNKWKVRRGIVLGVLLRGWMDAIYILPIDVFPDQVVHGDGMGIYAEFKEMGWHFFGEVSLLGRDLPVMVNPGYALGGIAILGMFYVTYRVAKCTPTVCGACRI